MEEEDRMAKYHFIAEKLAASLEGNTLPSRRISVEYGKYSYDPLGTFVRSEHFEDAPSGESIRKMIVGNCEGSLMVIDTVRDTSQNPVNKLHIGELYIRRPHAESYEHKGEKGFRVDLAELDTHYAKQMLRELELWRDAPHREQLLKQYEQQRKKSGEYRWYCMPYRVAQLKISRIGLEQKIAELQGKIKWLRTTPQCETRRFVYEHAVEIEKRSYQMVELMGFEMHPQKSMTRKPSSQPKVIVNADIFSLGEQIYLHLKAVLDFICPKVNVEKARNYWKDIAAWAEL